MTRPCRLAFAVILTAFLAAGLSAPPATLAEIHPFTSLGPTDPLANGPSIQTTRARRRTSPGNPGAAA